MKLDDCNALITGASAGIGREFARQLAGRARSMILVARREERLTELRDELQQQHPKLDVQIRTVDLANLAQLKELMESLNRDQVDVDLLINNAGLGDAGHVSSVAGFLPIPGDAVYAATKAYVTSFSEALRAELQGTGVSICSLCPGPVQTEFQEVAKRQGVQPKLGPKFFVVPAEQVVREALAALETDRPLVIPGFAVKVTMLVSRVMPMPVLRFLFRLSLRRSRAGSA